VARNTQVSLPRDLIRELAPNLTKSDDALIETLFGNPPKVLFQLYGDPPQAILVWPIANQGRAHQEFQDQQIDETKGQSEKPKGAASRQQRTAKDAADDSNL